MLHNDIKIQIKKDEGLRLFPYLDTQNKWTIGFGRNLSQKGISHSEANFMFDNDIKESLSELRALDWYSYQPKPVQNALLNMHFNLGLSKLLKFKRMIAAIKNKNYTKAAHEALDSRWATQVGERAIRIADMIRECDGKVQQ